MTSCRKSSARSRRGRSGSASRRWPRTASRRKTCTSRSPRKRSRSKRKSLRRRSEDGPSDDDSGAAEPRDLEEDRGDPGGRRLHLGKARGLKARASREVHREEGGREGPQETRHGPCRRGGKAGAEAREGQARGPCPEALGEGGRGGAGSAAHNPREGAAALGGRTGEPRRGEGERTMAPPGCRDGALEKTPWTQSPQEKPSKGPPANLREVLTPPERPHRSR